MLAPGAAIPQARVWAAPGGPALELGDAIAGDGDALLCFYPFDWSTTCASEVRLLHDRLEDLARARIRPFGISLDSPWSHRAWAEALAVADVLLLSDARAEAAAGFGVLGATDVGVPRAGRSAFLVRDGSVVAAWSLGSDLPDVDVIIAAAASLTR